MNTIITPDDIRNVRPVAENVTDIKRIQPYIREAEILDVMPSVGATLYRQVTHESFAETLKTNGSIQITTNSGNTVTLDSEQWDKFLNGAFYTCNTDGEKYSEGLISAIAHLSYARMLPNQPLNVTAFGVVNKTTALSEPVDEKILFRAANEARKIGLEYLRQSVEHLRCGGLIDDCIKNNVRRFRRFKAIG
jgi:hypothetical protein